MFESIDKLDSIGSTNEYLKAYIDEGKPRAAWAREQTGGKGRYGRSWHSAPNQGLYLSYLTFPDWPPGQSIRFIRIASLAVLDAARQSGGSGLDLRLKEPNDIYVGRRKICGILTELGSLPDRIEWAIVGIGLNLFHRRFPPELAPRATSLSLEGVEVDPEGVAELLTRQFAYYYGRFNAGFGGEVEERYLSEPRL